MPATLVQRTVACVVMLMLAAGTVALAAADRGDSEPRAAGEAPAVPGGTGASPTSVSDPTPAETDEPSEEASDPARSQAPAQPAPEPTSDATGPRSSRGSPGAAPTTSAPRATPTSPAPPRATPTTPAPSPSPSPEPDNPVRDLLEGLLGGS